MRLLWNESSLSGCKCPSEHIKGIWILVSRSFKLCEHSEETSKKPAKGERETKGRSVNALLMHPGHGQDFSLWEFCHAQFSSTETSPRKDFLQESLDLFFEETHCYFTAKPRSSWGFTCFSLLLRIPHFSPAESLSLPGKDSPPCGARGAGLPRHLPCLYIFQSFNLSPHRALSHPWLLQFACGNEEPSAEHRAPGPAYACSQWGDHGSCWHILSFLFLFFSPLQSSSFKIKITRKGEATEIKI